MTRERWTLLGAWLVLGAGCAAAEGDRGVDAVGGDVRTVQEGDYSPIAQYLVDHADTPLEQGASSGGSGGEASGDAGGTAGTGDAGGCAGFTCNDGACIDASWRCDAITDCTGGEDEADCGGGQGSGGGGSDGGGQACGGFTCDDGTCIDASWQCDGYTDCAGAEDESGCGGGGGSSGGGDGGGGDGSSCGFTCDDGSCIDGAWLCDGYVDCSGGEDESGCAARGSDLGLAAAPHVQRGALSCVATWTAGGAGTGALAGETISKACEGGGVIVGFVSGGTGFAAATVCFAADAVQLDAVVGGIIGALTGLVGGVANCEGSIFDEAAGALGNLLSSSSIPTYNVQANGTTAEKKCGVPVAVALSGDAAECMELHDDMKEWESTRPHDCSVDIGNLPKDAASIAAACTEIRKNFSNALELAEKRLAIGQKCYANGNQGPMGSSDFGHQVAWCNVRQSMQNCVDLARHPKLNCELTQTMAQHFLPAGCDDLIACN